MTEQHGVWTKWQGWLGVIQSEIYDLHHHHEIWRGLVDRIEMLDVAGSEYFLDAFTRMYVAGQAMGVRRQADTDSGTVSLGRLLVGLTNNTRVVTRDRFLEHWGVDEIDTGTERGQLERRHVSRRASDVWATFAGAPDRDRLNPAVPRADMDRLVTASEGVVRFANKTIAHTDAVRPDRLPTFGDLDAAVRVLGEIYCFYSILLTGSAPSPDSLAPTMQGDWLAPFRRPIA